MTSVEADGATAFKHRLQDQDADLRRSAILELTVIGAPFTDELLLLALHDGDQRNRQIAAEALAELATDQTIAALAEMLRLEESAPRNGAMDVLSRLGARCTPALELSLIHISEPTRPY